MPWTVGDSSSILSTPELGSMTFQLADLGFHVELFSKPHSSCWKWGCWIWGFFPSSTFTRSWTLDFLRTDWPAHYPHHGSFSLEEDPCGLCKGFGGSKGVNHLPTFFFFPKKRKKKIAHSTQFPARQFQIGTPVSQRPGHTAPSDKPRCLRNRSVGIALPAAAPLAPLSTNFLRLQEWREWDSGDSLPLL